MAFKHPIAVRLLSQAEARAFIEGEIAKTPKIEDFWAVKRMLGVYRGPDLAPPEKIYGDLIGLAAGLYDSYTNTFFQFEDLDEQLQRMLFAHELYHGLQDQYFDMQGYLVERARRPGVNNDEILARQAVIEGEATYIDSIYLGRMTNDPRPEREQLAAMIAAQAEWSPDKWEETARDLATPEESRARLLLAIETRKRLPRYMFETFVGAYVDGMSFIHAVHEKGWSEVEKLYRDHPPESRSRSCILRNGSRARRLSASPGRRSGPIRSSRTGNCWTRMFSARDCGASCSGNRGSRPRRIPRLPAGAGIATRFSGTGTATPTSC